MLTFHGAPADRWYADIEADYLPEDFATEGFIHTTVGVPGLVASLNRYYRSDPRAFVALLIDLDRITTAWTVAPHPTLTDEFPHIHGPLNRDAVIGVTPLRRAADGSFLALDEQ